MINSSILHSFFEFCIKIFVYLPYESLLLYFAIKCHSLINFIFFKCNPKCLILGKLSNQHSVKLNIYQVESPVLKEISSLFTLHLHRWLRGRYISNITKIQKFHCVLICCCDNCPSFEMCSEDREEDSTIQRGHPGGDHRAWTRACVYRRGTFPQFYSEVRCVSCYLKETQQSLHSWHYVARWVNPPLFPLECPHANCAAVFQDKMDQLLQMIQSADPTDNQSDSVELLQLEGKQNPGVQEVNKRRVGTQRLIWFSFVGWFVVDHACILQQVPAIRWVPSLTRSWRI